MADSVVLIAGNICAGKTELTRYIKTKLAPPDDVVEETIRENALRLFYLARDKHTGARKAITDLVEGMFLQDRLANHLVLKYDSGKRFIDRGVLEGVEIFAQNSKMEGDLNHDDFEDLQKRARKGFDQLDRREQEKWLEQLIVYLEVKDPDVLYERYQKRRREDELIQLGYLKRLNEGYAAFFSDVPGLYARYGLRAPQVLTIPASIDFEAETINRYHAQVWEQIQRKMKEMGMSNQKK